MSDLVAAGKQAQHINKCLDIIQNSAKHMVEVAKETGEFLINARKNVPHGKWAEWLADNVPRLSEHQARRYIKVAEKWDEAANLARAQDLSIRQICGMSDDDSEAPKAEAKQKSNPKPKPKSKSTKESNGESKKVQGTLIDKEPNEDFDGYNNDDNAGPPEVDTRNYGNEFRELWSDADGEAKAAIIDLATKIGSFKQMFLAALPEKKTAKKATKKSAKKTRFKPPTVEMVRKYCDERQNNVDPEYFVAYYESQDWKKANGQKLASWKQAVVLFEKSDNGPPRGSEAAAVKKRDVKSEERIQRMKARNAARRQNAT